MSVRATVQWCVDLRGPFALHRAEHTALQKAWVNIPSGAAFKKKQLNMGVIELFWLTSCLATLLHTLLCTSWYGQWKTTCLLWLRKSGYQEKLAVDLLKDCTSSFGPTAIGWNLLQHSNKLCRLASLVASCDITNRIVWCHWPPHHTASLQKLIFLAKTPSVHFMSGATFLCWLCTHLWNMK